jgi:hypothetical protein
VEHVGHGDRVDAASGSIFIINASNGRPEESVRPTAAR